MGGYFSSPANNYVVSEEDNYQSDSEEEEIIPEAIVELEAVNTEGEKDEIVPYCLKLMCTRFYGETSTEGQTDEASVTDVLNLGLYLSLLDKFLRQFDNPKDFTGNEEEYLHILRLVAHKRHKDKEDVERCYKRLVRDSKRFVPIYHKRGVKSTRLGHQAFWGSRQQLLSGKVIADWVDKENGSLDPLFGVLLQPTSGRVGPGDTGWFHDILFDDRGHMAYHSAVHDAFGYLLNFHQTGPGYDYMNNSYLSTDNCMAGQWGGIEFWQKVLSEIETKQKVINYLKL